jgi:hypothetical protein
MNEINIRTQTKKEIKEVCLTLFGLFCLQVWVLGHLCQGKHEWTFFIQRIALQTFHS